MKKVLLGIVIGLLIVGAAFAGWYFINKNGKDEKEVKNEVSNEVKNETKIETKNGRNETNNVDNNSNSQNKKYQEIIAKYDNPDDWIYKGKNTKTAFSSEKGDYVGLSISKITKNDDGTYIIQGAACKEYSLTDREYKSLETNKEYKINGEKYVVIESNDETYGLAKNKNSEYAQYRVRKDDHKLVSQDQWGTCYRGTEQYMQITVKGDVLVLDRAEISMESGEGKSVEEFYKSKKYVADDEENSTCSAYNFVFKDGKCLEIYAYPFES